MTTLETTLGYTFRDATLLAQALTHKSRGAHNNERLEYLGDAVLDLIVGEHLFRTRTDADEHALTILRAALVKKSTLAAMARELGLGEHMRLGAGELKSGSFRRDSILADTFEAVLGALYLDGGLEAVRALVLPIIEPRAAELDAVQVKDPKTRLQELLQGRRLALPSYEVQGATGADHDPVFEVSCRVAALDIIVSGRGRTRREAEQDAAGRAIDVVEQEVPSP